MDMPMGNSTDTGGDGGITMVMMQMWFTNSNIVTILFEGWKTSGPCSYWLSLLALFVASIGYEILSSLRTSLDSKKLNRMQHHHHGREHQGLLQHESLDDEVVVSQAVVAWYKKPAVAQELWWLLRTAIFGVQLVSGYLIMLAVMTYNWGVFCAIVLGRVLGYYLVVRFSCLKIPSTEEVCH